MIINNLIDRQLAIDYGRQARRREASQEKVCKKGRVFAPRLPSREEVR